MNIKKGKYPLIKAVKKALLNKMTLKDVNYEKKPDATMLSGSLSPASSSSAGRNKENNEKEETSDRDSHYYDAYEEEKKPIIRTEAKKVKQNDEEKKYCPNGDGQYADRDKECKGYYVCLYTGTKNFNLQRFDCPETTYFNAKSGVCEFQAKRC